MGHEDGVSSGNSGNTGNSGSTGSTVDRAFEALYASDDGSLDTAASLLAADRGADTELTRRGEEFVRTLWGRGWHTASVAQPEMSPAS